MKKAIFAVLLVAGFVSAQAVTVPSTLHFGSQSDEVGSLQTFLGVEPSTWFGAVTKSKVEEFQTKNELPVTGEVDCATRALIKSLTPCPAGAKSASSLGGTGTAKLSTLDTWYQQNCLPEPVGLEYGDITPIFYTPSGMGGTELAQINKPFIVNATGKSSTTNSARITASDDQVTITPASCTNGSNTGNMSCTVTVSGAPREIYLKIYNGRTGIKRVCHKVTLYRAPDTYTLGLSIDKNQFASNEAFQVTISGMTRAQLVSAYGNGQGYANAPFRITRSGAPYSSCENATTAGATGVACQGDSILSCGILPGADSSSPKFLCAATMLDTTSSFRYPNKNGPVTYTLTIARSNGLFDNYVPASSGYSDTIVLKKQGDAGGTTSYGNCSSGEGVDPRNPGNGCTRCLNIPNLYRSQIATCSDVQQDVFRWRGSPISSLAGYANYPECKSFSNFGEGNVCPGTGYTCVDKENMKSYSCTNGTGEGSMYHGKVLDAVTNQPLVDVTVQSWSVLGNMFSYAPNFSCPTAKTGANGDYTFSADDSKSICLTSQGYVKFTKAGYVEESIPVGNQFDKLIAQFKMKPSSGGGTPTNPADPNALSLSPSSATLAHQAGASITFTLANGASLKDAGKLDACYVIVRRNKDQYTTADIRENASVSTCNRDSKGKEWWIKPWSDTAKDWDKVGNNLVWKLDYTPAAFDICDGVQIVLAFRNRDTGQVTSSVFEVAGRPANDACHSSASPVSGYYWHNTLDGVASPLPPVCSSTPVHGEPCTQPNYGCQYNNKEYTCLLGAPAPKAAVVSSNSNPAPIDTNTGFTGTVVNIVNTVVVEPVVNVVETVTNVVSSIKGKIQTFFE